MSGSGHLSWSTYRSVPGTVGMNGATNSTRPRPPFGDLLPQTREVRLPAVPWVRLQEPQQRQPGVHALDLLHVGHAVAGQRGRAEDGDHRGR